MRLLFPLWRPINLLIRKRRPATCLTQPIDAIEHLEIDLLAVWLAFLYPADDGLIESCFTCERGLLDSKFRPNMGKLSLLYHCAHIPVSAFIDSLIVNMISIHAFWRDCKLYRWIGVGRNTESVKAAHALCCSLFQFLNLDCPTGLALDIEIDLT